MRHLDLELEKLEERIAPGGVSVGGVCGGGTAENTAKSHTNLRSRRVDNPRNRRATRQSRRVITRSRRATRQSPRVITRNRRAMRQSRRVITRNRRVTRQSPRVITRNRRVTRQSPRVTTVTRPNRRVTPRATRRNQRVTSAYSPPLARPAADQLRRQTLAHKRAPDGVDIPCQHHFPNSGAISLSAGRTRRTAHLRRQRTSVGPFLSAWATPESIHRRATRRHAPRPTTFAGGQRNTLARS